MKADTSRNVLLPRGNNVHPSRSRDVPRAGTATLRCGTTPGSPRSACSALRVSPQPPRQNIGTNEAR
eukprot:1481033-Rhodomonas_salina.1